ncbi:hypothetical protein HYV83_04220 [Candidatus Woesearchaeota archaeon]|nr:hypothetical protein [Candidatus Woesearchaeota archaeon]
MKKLTSILVICLVTFLLIAAPVSAFGLRDILSFLFSPFGKYIYKQVNNQTNDISERELKKTIERVQPTLQKYDETSKYDNMLYNNELSLNQTTTYWYAVKSTHNPTSIPLDDRYALLKKCYWLVRSFVQNINDTARYELGWDPLFNYNTLLCMHGYLVSEGKLIEQARTLNFGYEESKTLFSINQIMPDIYTEEELENLFGPRWRDGLYQGGQIMPFGTGSFLHAWGKTQIQLQEKIAGIKQQRESNTEIVVPNNTELEKVQTQQESVNIVTNYDFPKLDMNKQDIYDSFNYNSIVQKAFSDYNKIGLDVSGETYTFQLQEGKVKDITNGMDSDVDFKIATNWENLRNLIVAYKEGDTTGGMKAFWAMNMPINVKGHIASKII